jgi:hypothetical protein
MRIEAEVEFLEKESSWGKPLLNLTLIIPTSHKPWNTPRTSIMQRYENEESPPRSHQQPTKAEG